MAGDASSMDEATLLDARNLSKSFGGIIAVDEVSFSVAQGEIVGLIGPNGAGKTTTFHLLSGFLDPDGGELYFAGEQIDQLAPYQRARRGLVRTFQNTRELNGMTVLDNMVLGGQGNPGEKVLTTFTNRGSVAEFEDRIHARAREWLEILELWDLRDEYAGNLSGGQRKLLELGRALMTEPKLLLLDEPVAGVNPTLTQTLLNHLLRLRRDEDITFVIVEHDIETIMTISDKVVAMDTGRVLTAGSPEVVRQNDELLQAYLGDREVA